MIPRMLQFSFSNKAALGPCPPFWMPGLNWTPSCPRPQRACIIQLPRPHQDFVADQSQMCCNVGNAHPQRWTSAAHRKQQRAKVLARELVVACAPKAIVSNKWYFSPSMSLKPLCSTIYLSPSVLLFSYHTSWSNRILNIKHLSWGSSYSLPVFSGYTHIINNNNNNKK